MAREKRPQKVSPKLRFQLAAFILAAGLAAVLYGMPFGGKLGGGKLGGDTSEEPVTPAATADTLKPYAVGAVQNFVAAREPLPLEAIEFVDGDGNPLTLADFSGRVVLLNLWATWCAPCREEMPALDALQAEAGSDDFLVLALSLDRGGIEKPRDFLEEIEIEHLALYHDKTGRMGTRLGAFGLPTTLLIGRDGKSLGRLVGPAHWDDPDAVALIRAAVAAGQVDEVAASAADG